MLSIHSRFGLGTCRTSFSSSIRVLSRIKISSVAENRASSGVNSNNYFAPRTIHPSTCDALYTKGRALLDADRSQNKQDEQTLFNHLSDDEIFKLEQCHDSLSFIYLSALLMVQPYDMRFTTWEYDLIYQSIVDDINAPSNKNKRILLLNWWNVLAYTCEVNQPVNDHDETYGININSENYQQEDLEHVQPMPNFTTCKSGVAADDGEKNYQVYFRPGLIKFLQYVTKHFYVGIQNNNCNISICDCIEYINQEYLLKNNTKINFVFSGPQFGTPFGEKLKNSLPDKDLLFMTDPQSNSIDHTSYQSNSLKHQNKLIIHEYTYHDNDSKRVAISSAPDNKLDIAANYLKAWNDENDTTVREIKLNDNVFEVREDKLLRNTNFDPHTSVPARALSYFHPYYSNPFANIYSDEDSFTKNNIYLSSYRNLHENVSRCKICAREHVDGKYQTEYTQIPFLFYENCSRHDKTAANSNIDKFVDELQHCKLNENLPIMVVASEFFVDNWDCLTISDFMGIYEPHHTGWLPKNKKDKNKIYHNWNLKYNNEVRYMGNDDKEKNDQCAFIFELNPHIKVFLEHFTQNYNVIVWLENDCYRDWFEWINLQTLNTVTINKTATGFYPNVSTIPFKGLISSTYDRYSMFDGKNCLQCQLDLILKKSKSGNSQVEIDEKDQRMLPFTLPMEYMERFRKLDKVFQNDYYRKVHTVHSVYCSTVGNNKIKSRW